jgi:hypothetical protein
MTSPRRRARGLGAAAVTAAVASATLAAPALAAPSGSTTIDLKGPAAKALSGQQVKLSAKKPAKAGAKKIVLPVRGISLNRGAAKLTHNGAVTLRRKAGARTRAVTLTAWQTQIGTKRSTISAKLGGKRVTLFTAAAPQRRVTLDPDAGLARVTGATVRLTPAGAKALRAKLALRRLPAGQIGGAKVAAKTNAGSGGSGGGGGTTNPGGGGGGTTNPGGGGTTPPGGGGTTPTPNQCQGYSDNGPVPVADQPLASTVGANLSAVDFLWTPRESWTRYISGSYGRGDGISFGDGARSTAEVLPGSDAVLTYRFAFTPDLARSWYDPARKQGVIYHTGTVRYLWRARFLDITLKNPEIELNGSRSRVVFTVSGSSCSRLSERRVDLLTFVPASPAGPTYAFGQTSTRITLGGSNAMGGVYMPEDVDGWGGFSLTLTTR